MVATTSEIHEVRHGDLLVSTDPSRLDLDVIHGFLTRSYWAAGNPPRPRRAGRAPLALLRRLRGAAQVGFARVITDRATYATSATSSSCPSAPGAGRGQPAHGGDPAHPELQGLRRWKLVTRDAHGLYRQFGFGEARHPERLMEILAAPNRRGADGRRGAGAGR